MLAQRLSEADEILARLGGQCAAEYKYDGVRIQAHRTADGEIELFTRAAGADQQPVPRRGRGCCDAALGPREAILEGEVGRVRRRPRGSCGRSRRSCSVAASTASPRRPGTCP